jgi:hypothetical protein
MCATGRTQRARIIQHNGLEATAEMSRVPWGGAPPSRTSTAHSRNGGSTTSLTSLPSQLTGIATRCGEREEGVYRRLQTSIRQRTPIFLYSGTAHLLPAGTAFWPMISTNLLPACKRTGKQRGRNLCAKPELELVTCNVIGCPQ